MNLSARQENFAQLIFAGKSQADAYREAYKAHHMKPETVYPAASKVAKLYKVRTRIAELFKGLQMTVQFTQEDAYRELEEARVAASNQEKPQAAAMVAATMGKCKVAGLIRDTIDLNLTEEDKSVLKRNFGQSIGLFNADEQDSQEDSEGITRT